MTSTLNGKYWLGEPIQYTSIYGYAKFKYPVYDVDGKQGEIKEELILDGEGNKVATVYYTRSLARPNGAHRFYESPQALIQAFGGSMDRTHKKPAVPAKLPRAKKEPVAEIEAPKHKGRVKKIAATA